MSIYDDLQLVAKDLLVPDEFGQGLIELVQITPGAGPADDPGASTEDTTTLNGAVSGVSSEYVDQGFAVATDLMVITAVVEGITPNEKDFIELDGVRHKVVKDMSVPAIGTKVAWKFIVRKG
jgi:hypothetical protein